MSTQPREDAPYQPTLRKRDSAWRYAIVLAFAATFMAPLSIVWWTAGDLALGALCIGLLRYRRRWPLPVALVINTVGAISMSASGARFLAVGSLSTRRRWREIVPAVLCAMASFAVHASWVVVTVDGNDSTLLTVLVNDGSMLAIVVGWGLYIGSRRQLVWTLRERAIRAESEREAQTEQARDAERARIAREMHDVLAHRISQISLQAGAIAFRTDLDADALRGAARQLQTNANAALDDLRVVLGVLRDPDSGAVLDAPQPRAEDIGSLIDHARNDGMRIEADINLTAEVDDTTGRTLYRITQECITNARKHAPQTTLTIRITGSPTDGIRFTAENPLPIGDQSRSAVPSSGFGLIGLRERVELAGGTLDERESLRSFTVSCRLPWESAPSTPVPEYAQ